MDILTQYYNKAGQTISRSLDLATREFYRDYMCRHRFNEMFVATKERKQAGWFQTSSGIFLDCSYGESANPTLYPGFNTAPPSVNVAGEYHSVIGYKGRNAIKPTPQLINGSTIICFLNTDTCDAFESSSLRLRIIAKSEPVSSVVYAEGAIFCYLYKSKDNYSDFLSFGLIHQGDSRIFNGNGTAFHFNESSYDGWHTFDVLLSKDEPEKLAIDGEIIEHQLGTNYFNVFSATSPWLSVYMPTASENVSFSIDSVSVVKL